MSDECFKEIFRRLTSETPDPPAFSDLETHRAKPPAPIRFKPWMAAVGAAALVLVVVGAFGLLGGGGPDLAAPDKSTIDYIKLEYSSEVNLVCQNSETSLNGGSDEGTIEIYGPNSENLTLMVATFPGGSTERMVVEGDPMKPTRAWTTQARSGGGFDYTTGFQRATCDVNEAGRLISSTYVLDAPYSPPLLPYTYLGIPQDPESWQRGVESGDISQTTWNGRPALRLRLEAAPTFQTFDVYVAAENPRDLLSYQMEFSTPWGATSSVTIVGSGIAQVHESTIDFSTDGPEWTQVGFDASETDGDPPPDCPVTIPGQGFTPPDTHPPTPSGPDMVWYGKDELWTVLSTDGISEERKSVWWSSEFTDPGIESSPEITVTYTLLNSATPLTIVNDQGTNASTPEDGLFIIAGSEPPIEGCWQVTAIYKDASLTYIYYNPDGLEVSPGTVPDVVGMTVNEARSVLETLTFQAAFHDSANPTYEVCAQEPGAGLEISPGEIIGMRTAPLGGCEDLMDASLNPNSLYDTYQDQFGNVWYQTSCPEADVLITGGEDGLPRLGQTTKDRVEQVILLEEVQAELAEADFFLGNPGVSALSAVPRNGEVWDRDDNNDFVVTHVADYMIEAIIDSAAECPSAPQVWNGIPVAYVKIDTN